MKLAFVLFVIFLLGQDAFGARIASSPIDIVESSELIISGKVVKVSYYRNPEVVTIYKRESDANIEKDVLRTDYEIEVFDIFKGNHESPTLVLTQWGGCSRNECIKLSSSFSLALDEECVIAVRRSEDHPGKWLAVGGKRGVFVMTEEGGEISSEGGHVGKRRIDWLLDRIRQAKEAHE